MKLKTKYLFLLCLTMTSTTFSFRLTPRQFFDWYFSGIEYGISFALSGVGLFNLMRPKATKFLPVARHDAIDYVREQLRINRVPGWKTALIKVGPSWKTDGKNVIVLQSMPGEEPNYSTVDQLIDLTKQANTDEKRKALEPLEQVVRSSICRLAQMMKNNSTTKINYADLLVPFFTYGSIRLVESMFKKKMKKIKENAWLNNSWKMVRALICARLNPIVANMYRAGQNEKIDAMLLDDEQILKGFQDELKALDKVQEDTAYKWLGDVGVSCYQKSELCRRFMQRYMFPALPSTVSRLKAVGQRLAKYAPAPEPAKVPEPVK